jgi:hypothetical protein
VKLFLAFAAAACFTIAAMMLTGKADAQERIAEVTLLPTRQMLIAFEGQHGGVFWETYPIVYYFENEPHVCADPNDPRRQFQFDTAYVIPKEPDKVQEVAVNAKFE